MTSKQIQALHLPDLHTPSYQRPLSERRVKELVRKFNPNLVDTPTVSQRDGHYWIVDGQHTIAALLAKGALRHECAVLTGLSYEEEARLFAARNAGGTSRRLTASDKFRALLEAQDGTAQEIHTIARELGLRLPFEGGDTSSPDCIQAVEECQRVVQRHGVWVLSYTLRVIVRAWPNQPRRTHNLIIEGLAHFVARNHSRFDEKRLINRLATTTPAALIADSMTIHQLQGLKRHDAMVERIAAVHDKGLKNEANRLRAVA